MKRTSHIHQTSNSSCLSVAPSKLVSIVPVKSPHSTRSTFGTRVTCSLSFHTSPDSSIFLFISPPWLSRTLSFVLLPPPRPGYPPSFSASSLHPWFSTNTRTRVKQEVLHRFLHDQLENSVMTYDRWSSNPAGSDRQGEKEEAVVTKCILVFLQTDRKGVRSS